MTRKAFAKGRHLPREASCQGKALAKMREKLDKFINKTVVMLSTGWDVVDDRGDDTVKILEKVVGSKVRMRCKVLGDPKPVIRWTRNGTFITSSHLDRWVKSSVCTWGAFLVSFRHLQSVKTSLNFSKVNYHLSKRVYSFENFSLKTFITKTQTFSVRTYPFTILVKQNTQFCLLLSTATSDLGLNLAR